MKKVFEICGTGGVTVTWKVQEPVWLSEAVAVQVTSVLPTVNGELGAGVQLTDTGATPPVAVGSVKGTGTGEPLVDPTVIVAGHDTVGAAAAGGGSGGFGVGAVGESEPPQLTLMASANPTINPRTSRGRVRAFFLRK
jgi:hypothetical protein